MHRIRKGLRHPMGVGESHLSPEVFDGNQHSVAATYYVLAI